MKLEKEASFSSANASRGQVNGKASDRGTTLIALLLDVRSGWTTRIPRDWEIPLRRRRSKGGVLKKEVKRDYFYGYDSGIAAVEGIGRDLVFAGGAAVTRCNQGNGYREKLG